VHQVGKKDYYYIRIRGKQNMKKNELETISNLISSINIFWS